MSKSRAVVTRNLVHEAKHLLGAQDDQLDVVQWQSDLVSKIGSQYIRKAQLLSHQALRANMATGKRGGSFRAARHGPRQGR